MECGCIGHPYRKCSMFLELLDSGVEPDLAYGPQLKGSALPSSGYDRYRTDFSKGNAWPLLTRLARDSITNTISSPSFRVQPHPKKLLYGEESDQHLEHPPVPNNRPFTTTPSVLTVAKPFTNITEKTSSHMDKRQPNSTVPKPLISVTNEDCSDVSDLSAVYVPNMQGSFATYPPETTMTNAYYRAPVSVQHTDPPIVTDSTTCSIYTDAFGKENQSPNRATKRLSDKISMRQTLKRCRGPINTTSTTTLSADAEMNQIVSDTIADSSGSFDKSAVAVIQPRAQP